MDGEDAFPAMQEAQTENTVEEGADAGLSLETPEQEAARLNEMAGEVISDRAAQEAEFAPMAVVDAAEAEKIATHLKETLREVPATAELDVKKAHEEALLINEAVNEGKITDMEKLRTSEKLDNVVARLAEQKAGNEVAPRTKEVPAVAETQNESSAAAPSEDYSGALEYVGNTKDRSYTGVLGAWIEKRRSNQQGLGKYKWGTLAAGGTTLLTGIGASAAGYAAIGTGLALGAPAVLVGGGALWAGKKLFNRWKEKRAAKALNLHPDDTNIYA